MANIYREIYKAPGTVAFSVTGFIARMPISMISISLVAMFTAQGDSYGNAGYIVASYVLANAIISPQISRMADKYGQTKISVPATLIAVISLCLLLVAAHYKAPLYILILSAAFIGFNPSYGSFVRARWSTLYSGTPKLRSAFALESIFDEIIFMVGPLIAADLTERFFPEAGPLAAAFILLTGCLLFATQKRSEPVPHGATQEKTTSVIRSLPILVLLIMSICVGSIFGTAEVTAVAIARSLDMARYLALPLVAYALGSFIAGIVYGALPTRLSLARQLLISVTIAAITTLPLLLVSDLWSPSIVLFIAGAACSPTIIICMSLIETIVPARQLTEGMSWAITGLSIGVAVGALLSGHLIDTYGANSGFTVSILGGFIALFVALAAQRILIPKTNIHTVADI